MRKERQKGEGEVVQVASDLLCTVNDIHNIVYGDAALCYVGSKDHLARERG